MGTIKVDVTASDIAAHWPGDAVDNAIGEAVKRALYGPEAGRYTAYVDGETCDIIARDGSYPWRLPTVELPPECDVFEDRCFNRLPVEPFSFDGVVRE